MAKVVTVYTALLFSVHYMYVWVPLKFYKICIYWQIVMNFGYKV